MNVNAIIDSYNHPPSQSVESPMAPKLSHAIPNLSQLPICYLLLRVFP